MAGLSRASQNQRKTLPDPPKNRESDAKFTKGIPPNESGSQSPSPVGMILSSPKYPKMMKEKKT